ncbi:MAG: pentapeptide repeat-containing protein [Nostoc sp.]|uniref:pentapeptide repeat-containing protein n=1 Tax=Nostoc sp. TaxID=1180 RepID=UPI002FFBF761
MGRSCRASIDGLEKAKQALKIKGWTQEYLAGFAKCSRPVVINFFARRPVDQNKFQTICHELGLEWGDVADLESEQLSTSMNATQHKNSELVQEPSGNTQVKSYAFAIAGTVSPEDIAKFKAIAALLKDLAQDTSIQIVDVERGSIKLILEGSQEGLERLENLFRSGQLEDVLGVSVEDVEFVTLPNSNPSKKRLAFIIAGDVAESEIAILKAALTETSDDAVQQFESQRLASRDNPLRVNLILKNLIRGNFGGAFRILKNLIRADLSHADLSGADLSHADLSGADLSHADLSGANLSGADLGAGADLSRANLSFAYLGAALSRANLEANLSGANLEGANLSGANLEGANLSGANLESANLSRANLESAYLINAYLINAYLINAYLSGANLSHAYLINANLSGANLSHAYLEGAYLEGAYLEGADLSGADLSGADLSGADLSGANVVNAFFGESKGFTEDTKRDLESRGAIFGDRPPVLNPK